MDNGVYDYQPTTTRRVLHQPRYPYLPHLFLPVNRDIPDVQDDQASHELSALQGLFPYHWPNPRGH